MSKSMIRGKTVRTIPKWGVLNQIACRRRKNRDWAKRFNERMKKNGT